MVCRGIASTCKYPDTCHAISPPPPPGPSPPHTAGYIVAGAGDKACNGKYLPIAHPHADAGAPVYSKDASHQIYRYGGTWHVAHLGVVVFYDPPASSYWAAEPPHIQDVEKVLDEGPTGFQQIEPSQRSESSCPS